MPTPRRKRIPRVALLIETTRSYTRGMLAGVRRYVAENGPWSTFVELRVVTPPPIPGAPTKMEIPDMQFQRMGVEARALSTWLQEHARG